jgi:DUF4097 and DUF4098 domain-containing protein YvlB
MKTKPFIPVRAITVAIALLGFVATSRADVEDKITKSFTAKPGDQLVVDVDRGGIEVKTTDAESVSIQVTRKAGGSKSRAEQVLKDHAVTIAHDGNKVDVRSQYKGPKASGWFGRSLDLQVSYLITVPRKFDVDLKTAGGHVKVVQLTGKLKANTSGGNLDFEKVEGPVYGRTSGGHVTLAGVVGRVDLNTSGGNLNLSEIEGDITASTSGGHIKGSKLTGKSVVRTSGGNINVSGIKGSMVAETSGGHVTAELLQQPTGDCSFETSGGHITINLAEKVAVDIDARTDGGTASSEIPIATDGKPKSTVLHGKINGGGPLIKAHTSGGHVRVEKI